MAKKKFLGSRGIDGNEEPRQLEPAHRPDATEYIGGEQALAGRAKNRIASELFLDEKKSGAIGFFVGEPVGVPGPHQVLAAPFETRSDGQGQPHHLVVVDHHERARWEVRRGQREAL